MPAATAHIRIKVENLKAFTLAIEALHEIIGVEAETNDPDTALRSFGIGREIAQDALDEIEAMGVPTQRGEA